MLRRPHPRLYPAGAKLQRAASTEVQLLVRTWSSEEQNARTWSLKTMLLLKVTLPLLLGMLLCASA